VDSLLLQRQLADLLGLSAVFTALYLLLYFYYSILQKQLADLLGRAAVFTALYLLLYFYYSILQKQLADLLGPAAVFALPLTLPAQIAAQVPCYSIFTTVYIYYSPVLALPLNAASTDSCTCALSRSLCYVRT